MRRYFGIKYLYTLLNVTCVIFLGISILSGCSIEEVENPQKASKPVGVTKVAAKTFGLMGPEITGIDFENTVKESRKINVFTYKYFYNGGGVSIGDINNDGLPDIYFSANLKPNQLYLNKGNFKFENITHISRVTGDKGWANGVTMVDINSDGFLDIYVCKSGKFDLENRRNKLYINNGDLTFTEKAKHYGLDDPSYSNQAYFFDFDQDGDLDMFLLNHPVNQLEDLGQGDNLDFKRDPFAGDKLFENRGGQYVDISESAGIEGSPIGYGLSASIGDVNGDGYPDIYVACDFLEHDYLYINQQNGTFKDELKTRVKHISKFSMGSDIADINNDGHMDLMVLDMVAKDNYRSKTNMSGMNQAQFEGYVVSGLHHQYMVNCLQLNNGNGTFSEIAQLAGVDKTDWSWSALFMDYNQDGLRDLYVTNGLRKEIRNNDFVNEKKRLSKLMEQFPDSAEYYFGLIMRNRPEQKIPNVMFENQGNLHFEERSDLGLETPSFSNGAAYADLDGDGDLDLVVNNLDHPAFVYRNNGNKNNYLNIRLKGNSPNTSGIGARVKVYSGTEVQTAEHYLSRGFLSSSQDALHFGFGSQTEVEKIVVRWSDNTETIVASPEINQLLVISQKDAKEQIPIPKENDSLKTKLIALPFTHKENAFDDFSREVLLPHKMSNLGPALATGDVNGDGLDDIYVGGAKGQTGRLFLQDKKGNFSLSHSKVIQTNANAEEVIAAFFDYDQDGDLDLFIGTGGNESKEGSPALKDFIFTNVNGELTNRNLLPKNLNLSTGSFSFSDYDLDGDLDIFIGSRQTPGKYPYASSSYLLQNVGNKFVIEPNSVAPSLANLGMVTSSVWVDLDQDKIPELVVAGEWMPITVFKWVHGVFENHTQEFGFNQTNGWWYSLAIGDVDNDGDMDLIAGNLGLNYKYKASKEYPFELFYGDLNKDGNSDIVLSYAEDGSYYPLRGKQCSSQQIPELKQKFPTYDLFAKSTVQEVYQGTLNEDQKLSVFDFNSAIFINENTGFTRMNFPNNWQLFNWASVQLRDYDQDGNLDLFVAGNLYEAEVETPRCDAGNGLILKGNGDGSFQRVYPTDVSWGQGNVKTIRYLKTNNRPTVVVGANNEMINYLIIDK